jgi:hypothetical protein
LLQRRESSDVPIATDAPQETATLFNDLVGTGKHTRCRAIFPERQN